jgi:two-component system, cell cycle sensor histidine kinase and response regulator CckA
VRETVHDLNNQLGVILNFASFVLEDTPADDPRREDLQEILDAAKRARDLSLELLTELRAQPPGN